MGIVRIFYSAVTGKDGTVDPGYLALYWGMAVTVAMIPITLAACFALTIWKPGAEAEKILSSAAMIVTGLGVQGAAIIGAVGLFRMGDRDRAPTQAPVPPAQNTTNVSVAPNVTNTQE